MRAALDRSWTRPAPTPQQRRNDVRLALGAAVAGVASVEVWRSIYDSDLGIGGVEGYVLFAVAGLLFAPRRTAPLTTLVGESVVFFVIGERLGDLGATFVIQVVMFAALYGAWAWSRRPRALLVVTGLVVLAMFVWLMIALVRSEDLPTGEFGLMDARVAVFIYSLALNVAYFGGAVAWGQAAYNSARRLALIAQQQETERRLRSREQERALHDERVRIARDLHDVVAHHVSGIGVQAAGARRVLDRDPGLAGEALGVIEESSREAVRQMHQLVGLLRDDDESSREPQPGLADLRGLAGAPVEYREVGTPFAVPETVGVSLYRVAQEAVTNVRRHAGARRASLVLRYVGEAGAVEVEVLDDGRGQTRGEDDGGYGLRGIAERAALHDGEVEIGPRPQGGFRVRVRVPVPVPGPGAAT